MPLQVKFIGSKILISLLISLIILSHTIHCSSILFFPITSYSVSHIVVPQGYVYDLYGYYQYDSSKHVLIISVHTPSSIFAPSDYGGIFIYRLFDNNSILLQFIDYKPLNCYIIGSKLLTIGLIYYGEIKNPLEPADGMGFYLIDLDTFKILSKIKINERIHQIFLPEITAENTDNSILLPIPALIGNGTIHNRLYMVEVRDNKLNIRKVFDRESQYYIYSRPLMYGKYIFWGPYILSSENYSLLKTITLFSNYTDINLADNNYYLYHIGVIYNGLYIFSIAHHNENGSWIKIIYYNITDSQICCVSSIYNSNSDITFLYTNSIWDRYLVFIIGETGQYGLIDIEKIHIIVYDIVNKDISTFSFNEGEIYVGNYRDSILVFVPSSRKLFVIHFISNSFLITNSSLNIENLEKIGNMVLDYDFANDIYYLVFLTLFDSSIIVVKLTPKEITVLKEFSWISPILLFATVVITILNRYRRAFI